MHFEWDEEKNRSNLAEHKISFETAKLVFDDPNALSVQDCVVGEEERWQTLGMISDVIVVVAHTYRDQDDEEIVRLISARKAVPRERKAYGQNQRRSQ